MTNFFVLGAHFELQISPTTNRSSGRADDLLVRPLRVHADRFGNEIVAEGDFVDTAAAGRLVEVETDDVEFDAIVGGLALVDVVGVAVVVGAGVRGGGIDGDGSDVSPMILIAVSCVLI